MHLSIKDCNGALMIVVKEREHGEKIQLTSNDYLDLCALLGIEKFGVTGGHTALPKCFEPPFIIFRSFYIDLTPHLVFTQSWIKCIM